MKFVIMGRDGPDGHRKRPQLRPLHLKRLQELDAAGRLILAGPFREQSGTVAGSFVVIEAASLAEAEAFAREDPYTRQGVFQHVDVYPFDQVLPEES